MTKAKNCAIIAAASLMMVCIMAGTGFAYGPHHDGFRGDGNFNGYHQNRGGGFDKFLVDKGIPAATVNAYIADKDKFRAENEAIFDTMRAKGLELYEEMSKAAPDAGKAKALQAELSKLRSDFDAKRIDHQLYMNKTYPQVCEIMQKDFAKGFGPGHPGFGFGHQGFGHGPGMKTGPCPRY